MIEAAFMAFIRQLRRFGLEHFKLFYGVYRAEVVSVVDGDQGLVQLIVPSVNLDVPLIHPAYPMYAFAGDGYGTFHAPQPKDKVFVMFEAGRIEHPRWFGAWYAKGEIPPDFNRDDQGKNSKVYAMQTPAGHQVIINDETGQIRVKAADGNKPTFINLDRTGKIHVQTGDGNSIVMADKKDGENGGISLISEQGHWVALHEDGITAAANGEMLSLSSKGSLIQTAGNLVLKVGGILHLDAGAIMHNEGGEPVIGGQTLMTWINTHTHTATGPGAPTLPPTIPLPPTALRIQQKV